MQPQFRKCFHRAGILRQDFTVVVQPVLSAKTDPFADIDDTDGGDLVDDDAWRGRVN